VVRDEVQVSTATVTTAQEAGEAEGVGVVVGIEVEEDKSNLTLFTCCSGLKKLQLVDSDTLNESGFTGRP
jgi:hypothetical protein